MSDGVHQVGLKWIDSGVFENALVSRYRVSTSPSAELRRGTIVFVSFAGEGDAVGSTTEEARIDYAGSRDQTRVWSGAYLM